MMTMGPPALEMLAALGRKRRFVHVGLNFRRILPAPAVKTIHNCVQAYLDTLGGDWYRYAAQNYVVWTEKDPASLSREITQQPGLTNIYVLATEFNPSPYTANGMMPKVFWDWLHKQRI